MLHINMASRTGLPCKRWASHGSNVCRSHGAAAPQVKTAALHRLQQALEPLAMRLLGLALDSGVPEHVALSAVNSAVDRAGLTVKSAVGVGVSVKRYESILSQMESGSRAEWRRAQGIPDDSVS